ncbi:MAG: hypothetical protein HGA76_10045, partial [Candidatus Firestonebacteria bacterium]|nr:hypothetical protein [Candidatus Firestonebacteria bacterium]
MRKLSYFFLGTIFILVSCTSAMKHQTSIHHLRKLLILPPIVEVETFPGGRALLTGPEHLELQKTLVAAIHQQLNAGCLVEEAPFSPAWPEKLTKQLRNFFVQLQSSPDLAQSSLDETVKAFLTAQYGEGDVLVAYYTGFQRTPESMEHGYHNTAFQSELVPHTLSPGNDQINVPQVISLGLAQDQYVSLPKKYGATLRLVILQGTQKSPGFY